MSTIFNHFLLHITGTKSSQLITAECTRLTPIRKLRRVEKQPERDRSSLTARLENVLARYEDGGGEKFEGVFINRTDLDSRFETPKVFANFSPGLALKPWEQNTICRASTQP